MSQRIVEKARHILKGVQYDFEITFDWREEYDAPYYQYFSHENPEVRKCALLIFVGALGNWRLQSAHVFHEAGAYRLEDYIRSLLEHRESIEQTYPLLYARILWYLRRLDETKPFELDFPELDQQLLREMRGIVVDVDSSAFQNNFQDIINEMELL